MESNTCRAVVLYQPVWKEEIPPLISEEEFLEAVIGSVREFNYDEPFIYNPSRKAFLHSAVDIEHPTLYIDGSYSRSSCAPVGPSVQHPLAHVRDEALKRRWEEEVLLRREEEIRERRWLELITAAPVSAPGLQRGERYTNTDYAFMSALWRGSNNIQFWCDPTCPPYEADCCPGCMCYSCSGMKKVFFPLSLSFFQRVLTRFRQRRLAKL
ncbi:hypothetical protein C8R47DRAFT_1075259 [Mycena vitilis]|nr:hypothetical protein C8R47DRAFT_1075259 [Mycena vitilis]